MQVVLIKHKKENVRESTTGLNFANHDREATAHYKVGYRLEHISYTLNSAVKH